MFTKGAIAWILAALLGAGIAFAQQVIDVDVQPQVSTQFTPDELDQLLGAIALYPDPLIAQILPASTYPLDIVEAARFLEGGGTDDQIEQQDWDPSVKAIAHYPDVLNLLNANLRWTQQLGDAFSAQPDDVMQSIQRLRQRAYDLGNLSTTPEQQVVVDQQEIYVLPAQPEIIYVPVYSPAVVYVERPVYAASITFGAACYLGGWLDLECDWGNHFIVHLGWTWNHWHDHIEIDRGRFLRFNRPDLHPGDRHDSVWRRDDKRPHTLPGRRPTRPSDFDRFRGREHPTTQPQPRRIETPRPPADRGRNLQPDHRPPTPLTPSRPGTDTRRARERGNESLHGTPRTSPAPRPSAAPPASPPESPQRPSSPAPSPAAPPRTQPTPTGPRQQPPQRVPAHVPTPPVHIAPPPAASPAAPPFTGPRPQPSQPTQQPNRPTDGRHGRG